MGKKIEQTQDIEKSYEEMSEGELEFEMERQIQEDKKSEERYNELMSDISVILKSQKNSSKNPVKQVSSDHKSNVQKPSSYHASDIKLQEHKKKKVGCNIV